MRRPSKDSTHKLSADSQRLITLAQALGQAASRMEERNWERVLDAQLHKLLRTGHQDTVDTALNALFSVDLVAYDILMDSVEAVSESDSIVLEVDGEIVLAAVVGLGVVGQRHDRDAVGLHVARHTFGVDGDIVATVADQLSDLKAIALEPAAGKQADNTERDTHR